MKHNMAAFMGPTHIAEEVLANKATEPEAEPLNSAGAGQQVKIYCTSCRCACAGTSDCNDTWLVLETLSVPLELA